MLYFQCLSMNVVIPSEVWHFASSPLFFLADLTFLGRCCTDFCRSVFISSFSHYSFICVNFPSRYNFSLLLYSFLTCYAFFLGHALIFLDLYLFQPCHDVLIIFHRGTDLHILLCFFFWRVCNWYDCNFSSNFLFEGYVGFKLIAQFGLEDGLQLENSMIGQRANILYLICEWWFIFNKLLFISLIIALLYSSPTESYFPKLLLMA